MLACYYLAEYNLRFARKLLDVKHILLESAKAPRASCDSLRTMGGFFQPIFFAGTFLSRKVESTFDELATRR
jgi:hypothetical protein